MLIREASPSEAGLVANLVADSNRGVAERFGLTAENCPKHPSQCTESWGRADLARGERYFIACDGARPIGCVAYERARVDLAYLNRLSVLPAWRRQGVGERLVRQVIDLARADAVATISIGVIGEHRELQHWYRKLGFIDGEVRSYDHLPFAVLYMSYPLAAPTPPHRPPYRGRRAAQPRRLARMLGTHDLTLFIVSGLLLNVTPGADSLYIATRSATQGLAAGFAAVFGIGLGCCVHVLAAALGLSAVLATSAYAFTAVKLVGAAYLVWVGVSMLRARPAPSRVATLASAPLRTIVAQGFLTNVLNPKVALFFLAFVPQFIVPGAPDKPLAFIFLGAIFTANGVLWCLFLAWAAARVGALGVGGRAALWLNRGVGALFVALGVRLALARQA